jgi:hypothetical protein
MGTWIKAFKITLKAFQFVLDTSQEKCEMLKIKLE